MLAKNNLGRPSAGFAEICGEFCSADLEASRRGSLAGHCYRRISKRVQGALWNLGRCGILHRREGALRAFDVANVKDIMYVLVSIGAQPRGCCTVNRSDGMTQADKDAKGEDAVG